MSPVTGGPSYTTPGTGGPADGDTKGVGEGDSSTTTQVTVRRNGWTSHSPGSLNRGPSPTSKIDQITGSYSKMGYS